MMQSPQEPVQGRSAGHVVMFWLLSSMAILVFFPCVLAPIWVETQNLRTIELDMAHLVTEMEASVARNEERTDALLNDPLVNQRIAHRELNLRDQDEEIIRWTPQELDQLRQRTITTTDAQAVASTQPPPPTWVQGVAKWLPDWPWEQLFARAPNRPLILMMSLGLIATAFILYTPVPTTKAR